MNAAYPSQANDALTGLKLCLNSLSMHCIYFIHVVACVLPDFHYSSLVGSYV